MLSAATSCSSRLHHCPRLARFVLAFKSSLLYSSKLFMNIPSVPGGNGPIFDTRYCRRKFLQNLARGIGWLASTEFGPRPHPGRHFSATWLHRLEQSNSKQPSINQLIRRHAELGGLPAWIDRRKVGVGSD